MDFNTFIGGEKFSGNCLKATLIISRKNIKLNEESLENSMTPLLQYRTVMVDSMEQYELNHKQKLFLWYFGMGGKISIWFEDCFHILQDQIFDLTFDHICSLIMICFNRTSGIWEANRTCLKLFDAFNSNGKFNKDGFKNLQDIPHINKLFPLIVTTLDCNKAGVYPQQKKLVEYTDAIDVITAFLRLRGI